MGCYSSIFQEVRLVPVVPPVKQAMLLCWIRHNIPTLNTGLSEIGLNTRMGILLRLIVPVLSEAEVMQQKAST
jgi:hypothetical protein